MATQSRDTHMEAERFKAEKRDFRDALSPHDTLTF